MFKIYFQRAAMFFFGNLKQQSLSVSAQLRADGWSFVVNETRKLHSVAADNTQLWNINVSVTFTEIFAALEVHKRDGEQWDPSPSACSGLSSRVRAPLDEKEKEPRV